MVKVSIIIPTYNRSCFLKEAIISILCQTYQNFEIIVTDNNSSDDTEQVIKSFADPRIIYKKNSENIGSVRNYNEALKWATGEYIHLFSDDDKMLSNCILDKVNVLNEYPDVGVVHSNVNVIDQDSKIISDEHYCFKVYKKWKKKHSVSKAFNPKQYHYYLLVENIVCMPAVMMRRSVFEKIGYFDADLLYIVDWQYWIKVSLFFDFYYINEKLISYRVHSSNTVKSLSIRILDSELGKIWNDLQTNYKSDLFVKNKLHLFLLKLYYKSNHRHFYTYPIRRLIEFFVPGRHIGPLTSEIKIFFKKIFKTRASEC